MINLKLLIVITDDGYDKKITSILNSLGIRFKVVATGSGTASPSVLDYFGLIERKKDIYLAIIPDYLKGKVLEKLNNYFNFNEAGTGVCFILPLSSANKFLVEPYQTSSKERNDYKMENNDTNKYHLIITIVSEGYLEQVMTVAKKAGSSGGTALKGRGLSNSRPAKILGFNIEPEKDIILNIVNDKNKQQVMTEITKAVGIKTQGKGVCISIPVEDAIGFNFIN